MCMDDQMGPGGTAPFTPSPSPPQNSRGSNILQAMMPMLNKSFLGALSPISQPGIAGMLSPLLARLFK